MIGVLIIQARNIAYLKPVEVLLHLPDFGEVIGHTIVIAAVLLLDLLCHQL